MAGAIMAHDYAVYGAIGGITSIAIIAMVFAVGDGLIAAAIAALATLGGVKIAQSGVSK